MCIRHLKVNTHQTPQQTPRAPCNACNRPRCIVLVHYTVMMSHRPTEPTIVSTSNTKLRLKFRTKRGVIRCQCLLRTICQFPDDHQSSAQRLDNPCVLFDEFFSLVVSFFMSVGKWIQPFDATMWAQPKVIPVVS